MEPTPINLKTYFTQKAVGVVLEEPAEIKTPLYDKFFRSNARQHPLPSIGIERLMQLAQARPLVLDGTEAINVRQGRTITEGVTPEPIRLKSFMSAREVNMMRLLPRVQDRQTLADGHIRTIRGDVNMTIEGLCAMAMTGVLTWPIRVSSAGYDTFTIDFTAYADEKSSIITLRPEKDLTARNGLTAADFVEYFQALEREFQKRGAAAPAEWLAGKNMWAAALQVTNSRKRDDAIRVEMRKDGMESVIEIGGYVIRQWSYTYSFPKIVNGIVGDERRVEVGDDEILGVSADTNLPFRFLSISDLDAPGFVAQPLFVKTITKADPSGEEIIGHTTPLPIPIPRVIARPTVKPEA